MIKKLLPIILLIFGAGAGVGAGLFLRPPPPPVPEEGSAEDAAMKSEAAEKAEMEEAEAEAAKYEYLKMNNQFIVPVVKEARVVSMVVMSLSLEVEIGNTQAIYGMEPKLRDSFLKVLFDYANFGGFDGVFTDVSRLEDLIRALRDVAQRDAGEIVQDVLITEIARQDY